jgi:hypothetical protein
MLMVNEVKIPLATFLNFNGPDLTGEGIDIVLNLKVGDYVDITGKLIDVTYTLERIL